MRSNSKYSKYVALPKNTSVRNKHSPKSVVKSEPCGLKHCVCVCVCVCMCVYVCVREREQERERERE